MHKPQCQMSIHQGDKPPHVIDQVSISEPKFTAGHSFFPVNRQVQDLEKQLVQARQQLNSLRSLSKEGSMDIDAEISHQSTLNLPDIGSHPHRHPRPPPSHDLSRVRANLRNIGRGVFKPPPPYRQLGPQPSFSPPRPALLPRGQAEHILDQYYSNVHTVIPILHWPTFCKEVDEVYKAGTLHGFPPIWGSLFFSVLACGTIHTTSPSNKKLDEGKEYIEAAQRMVDFYDDEFAVNNVRQALLTSVFLCEMNLKSAAWVWLGASIRMAQDIGLHCDTGPWPAIENEMRKRVWWGIYVWDRSALIEKYCPQTSADLNRLLSLELGRPLQIDDDDCDVGLPCPVDDRFIHDSGILAPSGASQPGNFLLSTIHVVRSIGQLKKTLKAPVLTSQTLHTFETHFAACMATFPPSCQPNSPDYLDPRYLSPVFYLQNVRLALHRHNLSTSSLPEARSTALDHCVATARDTFRFLSRAMSSPQSSPNSQERQRPWEDRLAAAATTLLCAHIWRCTLFLCFRAYYTEALACIRASAAIGDNRAVNVACGRNLASFLRVLVARLQRGEGNNLDRDEEMMAYVSGDVQASAESSWVWHGSETGMTLNNIEKSSSLFQSSGARSEGASHMPSLTVLTPEEANDWGGWEKQKWLLETLLREQRGASGHVRSSPDSSPPSVMPPPQPSAQSLSRISIANII